MTEKERRCKGQRPDGRRCAVTGPRVGADGYCYNHRPGTRAAFRRRLREDAVDQRAVALAELRRYSPALHAAEDALRELARVRGARFEPVGRGVALEAAGEVRELRETIEQRGGKT